MTGTLEMDYLKLQNWWTWSGATGDKVTVDMSSVTVIFDDYFYVDDNPGQTTETTQTTTATTTSETSTTTVTSSVPEGDAIGKAYFIGGLGADQNWTAGENEGAAITPITGDGTYTVSWDVTGGGGTNTVQFLAVVIAPDGGKPKTSPLIHSKTSRFLWMKYGSTAKSWQITPLAQSPSTHATMKKALPA